MRRRSLAFKTGQSSAEIIRVDEAQQLVATWGQPNESIVLCLFNL